MLLLVLNIKNLLFLGKLQHTHYITITLDCQPFRTNSLVTFMIKYSYKTNEETRYGCE